jgi:hypothetical protein
MKTNSLLVFLVVAIVILEVHQFWTAKSVFHIDIGDSKLLAAPEQRLNDEDNITIPPLVHSLYDGKTSFAACLLVSDDNHWLIEWLAYHSQRLPLRYLVVSSDPRARTSPTVVLERWKQHMTIVQWSDEHFLPMHWRNRIIPEENSKGLLMKHRERQRHFYPACFEFLKAANRTWVAVVDVDEFLAMNPYFQSANMDQQAHSTNHTVLETIQQSPTHRNRSCITIPRLRYGTYIDGNSTQKRWVPTGLMPDFKDSDFLTLQWKWRGPLNSRKVNKLPKSILDVSAIDFFDRQDTDAHRPSRSSCPRGNLYTRVHASPLVIHHYVGSEEQFLFRKDARQQMDARSATKLEEYGRICGGMEEYIGEWLQEFVESHGVVEAQSLLNGVGNVSFSSIS